ncbi:MAG: helix-turn-helix domain-containing protein [Paenibacillaceae bacterium]
MNVEHVKAQLEIILDTPFRSSHIPIQDWPKKTEVRNQRNRAGELADWMEEGGTIYFRLNVDGGQVRILSAEAALITESERKLVVLVIDALRTADKSVIRNVNSDDEHMALSIRDWIEEQLRDNSLLGSEPPESLSGLSALYARKIPLLLYCEYANNNNVNYSELKKLLDSFFDVEVLLLPLLDKEWLILGPESLIMTDREDELLEEESVEDALASLCSGLHTMMSSEWVGDYHVSSYYPMVPAQSLPSVVRKLREAINIGRMQRDGQYIHLPWQLYLDQLLAPIPLADKLTFIEQIFKRVDPFLDAETTQTLESFFELDCNVSETAKKLFIHRNTLLYRLDKFKQETGLDVRSFKQAIHVKLALQLYKVTKRK